jgi:hypothetical protein
VTGPNIHNEHNDVTGRRTALAVDLLRAAGPMPARSIENTEDAMEGENLPLSNSMADLAERVRQATTRGKAASVEAAEAYLEAGRLLIEAKGACGHGHWLPFLARAGVHERQARRMMQLARSGLKSDTVSDIGVKAVLEKIGQSEALKRAWRRASPQARRMFIEWLRTQPPP